MHLNDKVSYYLSDLFFKKLLNVDMIANESDPETWNELAEVLEGKEEAPTYNFYSQFYLFPIEKERIRNVFRNSNYFNSMLSGIEGPQVDFQESTVLDMFIFQTGKKYGKKTVGLEDAMGSVLPILSLTAEDIAPAEENKATLVKMFKNKNYMEVIKQYYREKDIVMLDSLFRLAMSKKAHDLFITNRNATMAKNLDSLARKGSVFSAVGAAHLAGNHGIINLLRRKGYTVTPILDEFTDQGKDQKKTIEAFFPNPRFEIDNGPDGMIKVPMPKKRVLKDNNVASLDFTNGGVVSIKRLPLNDFMNKDGRNFNPKTLDSLLFENIPGDIIERKYSEQANAHVYDIKNVTKAGNAQHYRFYITPLELIAVSMLGSGNYVRQYENEVFSRIQVKPFGDAWETITPEKGGFTVSVPAFNFSYGTNPNQAEDIAIQAYDKAEKGYYFLTEKTLSDTDMLENTSYEHRQIHYQFYRQQKLDSAKTGFSKDMLRFHSQSATGKIKLQTVISGQKYYLLGTVNVSDSNTTRFFDSFALAPFGYREKTKTFSDVETGYKILLPEKRNTMNFMKFGDNVIKDDNIFNPRFNYKTFAADSGKKINLIVKRYGKYQSETSLDSIRAEFRDMFIKNESTVTDYEEYEDDEYYASTSLLNGALNQEKGFSRSKWDEEIPLQQPEKYYIISEDESFDKEKNIRIFNTTVGRTGATQTVRHKVLFREDGSLTLSALSDRQGAADAFIEKAYSSLDFATQCKNSVFDKNKFKLFIADAKSDQDTIRNAAMSAVFYLEISKDDFDQAADFLNTFDFKKNENTAKISLLAKIGGLKDGRVIPFLEKYYAQPDTDAETQLAVLRALTFQKSKAAYKKIGELMKSDLPLSDSEYDISSLFHCFTGDLENSKELFPSVFKFYTTEEYKTPIISFCNHLLDKGFVSIKNLGSFKEMILDHATIKAKRLATRSKPTNDDERYETDFADTQTADLTEHAKLLYHFPQDKSTNAFFAKLKALDNEQINMELFRLDMINNRLTDAEIAKALESPKMRYAAVQLLLYNKKTLPDTLSDDDIAKSALINFYGIDDKDAIALLEKRTLAIKGKNVTFYFFRHETKDEETKATNQFLYPIAFVNGNNKIMPLAYKVFYARHNVADDQLDEKYKEIIASAQEEYHPRSKEGVVEETEVPAMPFE